MHFVDGHGEVADSPDDEGSHILYAKVAFFDGETERVGQIVQWGRSKDALLLSAKGADGRYADFYVRWMPLFQRYQAN